MGKPTAGWWVARTADKTGSHSDVLKADAMEQPSAAKMVGLTVALLAAWKAEEWANAMAEKMELPSAALKASLRAATKVVSRAGQMAEPTAEKLAVSRAAAKADVMAGWWAASKAAP